MRLYFGLAKFWSLHKYARLAQHLFSNGIIFKTKASVGKTVVPKYTESELP